MYHNLDIANKAKTIEYHIWYVASPHFKIENNDDRHFS